VFFGQAADDFFPGFAAVGCFINTAIFAEGVFVSRRCDIDNLGILGVNKYTSDML
jgi:hypothetical protein